MKRAQTSTEYLVIFAAVIVIGIIIITILGKFPSIGIGTDKQVDDFSLRSGKVGIDTYYVGSNYALLKVANHHYKSIRVSNISVGSLWCDSADYNFTLKVGASLMVTCSNFGSSEIPISVTPQILITWTDIYSNAEYVETYDGYISSANLSEDAPPVISVNVTGSQEWNVTWGGSGADYGLKLDADSSGNIYVVGYENSFDYNNYGPGGNADIVVWKLNSSGQQEWNITWGGANNDYGYGIAVDTSDNIYVVGVDGSFSDATYGAGGGDDVLLLKLDSSGSQLWNVTWGGSGADIAYSVTVDSSDENIYVSGYENSFSPDTYGPGGSSDIFLIKFDSSGSQLWNVTWGGSEAEYAFSMDIDSSDNIYITGAEKSFSPDTYGPGGLFDMLALKFDSSGSQLWNVTWGGSSNEFGYGMTLDDSNNMYIVGAENSFDYNNYGSGGGTDIVIWKLNSSGANEWNITWGGGNNDAGGQGIAADNSGNVYAGGFESSYSGATYGDGGGQDLVIIKLNSSGSQISNITWGGSGADGGKGMIFNDGYLYMTGREASYTPATYGPGGNLDLLLLKFS
jgi:hypothetical protein